MKCRIKPGMLSGEVSLPPSKSMLHRYMIAAALASGESRISNYLPSGDMEATLGAIRALGADCETENAVLSIKGIRSVPENVHIYCAESGSTLRFMIPVALVLTRSAEFSGAGRLFERPLEPYFDIFREKGIGFTMTGGTLRVEGALKPGKYSLRGDISSQFITGLLFALTMLDGDSEIEVAGCLESRGYVDMTVQALSEFGVDTVTEDGGIFRIRGCGRYEPRIIIAEADFSQAAFFLAANELGSSVSMSLPDNSKQGDRGIFNIIDEFRKDADVTIDVSQVPDLVPAAAVIAALRDGRRTVLANASRLRMKESDRLEAVKGLLSAMGADIAVREDSLVIKGGSFLNGAEVDSCNDHRIAMAAAIAAVRASGDVVISRAECVGKSYPGFWDDYKRLGGKICFI